MTTHGDDVLQASETLHVTIRDTLKPGGQKTVYLVENQAGEQLVMKIIWLSGQDGTSLVRANREVDLLSTVSNPHVVKAVSVLTPIGEPPHAVAWLEEWLDGEDVGDLLGPQWPIRETLALGSHMSLGLAALHERGVVHRDLSANNVRRLKDGTYKILDPGYARHTLLSGITYGGQPGTPGFYSPEHVLPVAGGPTPASDVFQVGILLYISLTGAMPFPLDGGEEDYYRHLVSSEYKPIDGYRSDVNDELIACIGRCLHSQSGRRYRNGAHLAFAIGEIS